MLQQNNSVSLLADSQITHAYKEDGIISLGW